eukprot:6898211-Pyramimonas_sp.AAC.1
MRGRADALRAGHLRGSAPHPRGRGPGALPAKLWTHVKLFAPERRGPRWEPAPDAEVAPGWEADP